jgi:transposase-like protein
MRQRHRSRKAYPDSVKEAAVQRYLTTDLTQTAVAAQFGMDPSSLVNWVKQLEQRSSVSKKKVSRAGAVSGITSDARAAEEKLRLLVEAGRLTEDELGEFLRREGLRDGDLERFRMEAIGGLGGEIRSEADRRRIEELERTNSKQVKRLREAEALLELQKKVHELWGAKEDDTDES